MTLLKPAGVDGLASVRWDDARKAIGADVIPLTVADMDYATPQPVVDAVVARAAAGNYCYTYLTDEYYDAVVEWMHNRHHWTITTEEIIAVGRMVESLPAVLRETVGKGAQVVVPYPAYSPTPAAVRAAGCHVVPWNLKMEGNRFVYDFDSLPFLLEDADAMVITNPHNPTCRVWTEDELRRIATIAEQAGVLVISDEFHMDLTTPGHDFIPYLTCVDDPHTALAISFTSPGKTFNMAGLETANIIVTNPELRSAVRQAIDDAGCHNPRFFAQVATVAAYRECGPWLDELLESVRRHADQLARTAAELPGLTMGTPEGTYLAWLDFQGTGLNDAQFKERLAEQQLAFTPGIEFGNGGSGFMRVNLAVPDELFDEAMARLRKALA